MLTKKVKKRFIFLSLFLSILVLLIFFLLKSLTSNILYFKTPTEIQTSYEMSQKKNKSWRNGKKEFIKSKK